MWQFDGVVGVEAHASAGAGADDTAVYREPQVDMTALAAEEAEERPSAAGVIGTVADDPVGATRRDARRDAAERAHTAGERRAAEVRTDSSSSDVAPSAARQTARSEKGVSTISSPPGGAAASGGAVRSSRVGAGPRKVPRVKKPTAGPGGASVKAPVAASARAPDVSTQAVVRGKIEAVVPTPETAAIAVDAIRVRFDRAVSTGECASASALLTDAQMLDRKRDFSGWFDRLTEARVLGRCRQSKE